MGRKSNRPMVRVYLAEIPEKEKEVKVQSRWAHKLLEIALQKEYSFINGPVLLKRDAKGKPFLVKYPQIYINLSHSGSYVACVIGEKSVGVDIECWKSRKRQELVIKRFHPQEKKLYEDTEEAERERLFYDLWVLKESFMKAEGSGLWIPLDSFYMETLNKKSGIVKHERNSKNYYYKLYRLKDQRFSLAVCSEEVDFAPEPFWVQSLENPSN